MTSRKRENIILQNLTRSTSYLGLGERSFQYYANACKLQFGWMKGTILYCSRFSCLNDQVRNKSCTPSIRHLNYGACVRSHRINSLLASHRSCRVPPRAPPPWPIDAAPFCRRYSYQVPGTVYGVREEQRHAGPVVCRGRTDR